MRLILIFLITSFVSVGVNSYSQTARLSVNMESATIEEIFDAIEKQSEYIFFYQDQNIDLNRVVSIEVEHKTINEVLDELFKDTGNTYQIKDRQVLIGFDNSKVKSKNEQKEPNNESLQPQKKTITGKVTDANGEPLPGASIIVKGTTIGVTGDVDGNYTLEIPNDAEVLVFSFVGMKVQEIAIGEQTQINISLEEETFGLEEVVAVGYGVQKKTNLTGAVSQIEADKISARPSASITQSLQGALPGLNIKNTTGDPRSTPEINIRGFNSINGGSPLVLIDGIEGNLNLINPTDIESVSVLKDAASAAIYGARGAFGVILVTTKKGVEGEPVITYNNNFSFTTPTARTDFITNPYDYGKIVDAAIYGYNGSSFTGYNDADWERIKRVADGEVAPYNELQANGTFKFFNKTNWYDYLFRKYQSSQNHNISVSGGTKKLKAYLSGRVYKSNTIQKIVDEDYKKYNLKSNIAYQVNDWLEISDNIQYSVGDTKEFGGNRNGWGDTWTYTKNYLYAFMPTQIDGVPYDMYGESDHASLEAGNSWVRNYYKQFINTFRAKLTPIKGLEINFDYSNRINHSGVSTRLNEFQYLTTDHITLSNVGINRLTETRTETNYDALNLFGTYSRTFATKHNLKLMVGFNQESSDQDVILAEQGGLSNPEYANLNLGTEVLRADGSAQLWAVQGYFGRFNYDFENRYLLEFNARYDGSSRFPSESRWGFFPSVSTGWYLSRENFWKPLEDKINSLKFRGSYGVLGNQNVGLYTFAQLLSVGQSNWLSNNAPLNYMGIPDPLPGTVTWEKTSTLDFGADLAFLNNRLQASFDWYKKNTTDMYLPGEPLPSVFGASEPKENIADLNVTGFELSISYRTTFDVKSKPLNLSATLNVSNFVAEITKYPNPEGVMSDAWEGQKLGEIWGYRVDGQFQSDEEAKAYQESFANPTSDLGQVYSFIMNTVQNEEWKGLRAGDIKFLDLDNDGEISRGDYTLEDHGDIEVIGNAMPKFPFGFNINGEWNGFDFSMVGTGVLKQDWYPEGKIYWGSYERPYMTFIRKDLIENAWSEENSKGKYPQIQRGYAAMKSSRSLGAVNDYYLTNIGYMRIKNLTLGYTLPVSLTKKVNIKKVRLFVSAENVFTIRFGDLTKYIDPEQAGSGISYSDPAGATKRSSVEDYPMGKIYSFGINVSL